MGTTSSGGLLAFGETWGKSSRWNVWKLLENLVALVSSPVPERDDWGKAGRTSCQSEFLCLDLQALLLAVIWSRTCGPAPPRDGRPPFLLGFLSQSVLVLPQRGSFPGREQRQWQR